MDVAIQQKIWARMASGEAVKTEIAGVYEVSTLSGTAVNTPKAEVQKAIGLPKHAVNARGRVDLDIIISRCALLFLFKILLIY